MLQHLCGSCEASQGGRGVSGFGAIGFQAVVWQVQGSELQRKLLEGLKALGCRDVGRGVAMVGSTPESPNWSSPETLAPTPEALNNIELSRKTTQTRVPKSLETLVPESPSTRNQL